MKNSFPRGEPVGHAASVNSGGPDRIQNSDERFRPAAQTGKLCAFEWDARAGIAVFSGECGDVLGIQEGTPVAGMQILSKVHPDDRDLAWTAMTDAMQKARPHVAEFRIVRPDGVVRWVAAQGKFYYSSAGEPERSLGIIVDITERKSVEEALRRKCIELSEVQRLARVGSWEWDPETDTVEWSDELYRIAGRDPELPAVSYREHSRLYAAESWERLRGAVEEALRTGAPYELELQMIRGDSSTRWVAARGEPQRDEAGRIVRLRGTIQDITERKRSQEVLRESEERLRLAAEAGRMYAYEWDVASDVITRSAEFEHILGVRAVTKITTCGEMLAAVHPDDQSNLLAATRGCTPDNPICRVEYRLVRPDGSSVWLEKNARAFFDKEGHMVRMIGMIADITEQKLAQEALSGLSRKLIEAQEAERARIARDLHDDIAQRLAVLSVMLDEIKAPLRSDDEVPDMIDQVREHVREISDSIHALSHELHSSRLRDPDIMNAIRGFCMELSEQQKVDIDFICHNVPPKAPPDISLCLFRILQEALHNAVKHSAVRHFQVNLCGTSDGLCLTIRDCGVGFDPSAAMKEGGLGLTSMRERLKLVGGELFMESQPSRGATIRASVPLPQPAASTAASAQV